MPLTRTAGQENAPLLVKTPITGIEALYGVCCIDYLPDDSREFKDWAYYIPVCAPALHGVRIAVTPFLLYLVADCNSLLL